MNWRLPLPPQVSSRLLLQALDALLGREPWALDQLATHAGKSIRLSLGDVWHLQASLSSDGRLQPCTPDVVPDVTLCLPTTRLYELPGVWRQQGAAGLTALMHIEGDAGLARLIADLARNLRWDPEEDLSRLTGDILAVRLMALVRRVPGAARAVAMRAEDDLGEYLAHESQLAVGSAEFCGCTDTLAGLASRLDRLESRLGRLERAC